MNTSLIRRRILAPLRPSTDVIRGNNASIITVSSALSMADYHHNYASTLPNAASATSGVQTCCVSQTVETFSMSPDLLLGCETRKISASPADRLARRGAEGASSFDVHPLLLSDMWVARVGRTSITYGHRLVAPTPDGGAAVAARARRTYVRVADADGRPVPFDGAERAAATLAAEEGGGLLPEAEAAPSPDDLAALRARSREKFRTLVGTHHCNHRGLKKAHVDHAALADMALQGFALCDVPHEGRKCSFHYRAPAREGTFVSCHVVERLGLSLLYEHGDQGGAGNKPDTLLMIAILGGSSLPKSSL